MTDRYVYSGAAGAGTGVDFTNAYTTIGAAITASAAGDLFRVASDHAEDTSGTITFKGTIDLPDKLVCVNRGTGAPETMVTGGGRLGSTTGNSIAISGNVTTWGLHYRLGGGTGGGTTATLTLGATGTYQKHENVRFTLPNTSASRVNTAGVCVIDNYSIDSLSASAYISSGTLTYLRNSSTPWLTTSPSFGIGNGASGTYHIQGLDLMTLAGKTLVQTTANQRTVEMSGCKIPSTLTISQPLNRVDRIDLVYCTDETGLLRHERHRRSGVLTRNTTIYRSGGASEDGTNFSWKIATTSAATRDAPFESFEMDFWVPQAKVGNSTTATIHTVTDNVTLTDAEANLEIFAAVTASQALHTRSNDGPATVLATPANQATSTETWTTTGLSTPVKQKLAVTFTPTRAGAHRLVVRIGKASSIVYVCPKVEIA